MILGALVAWACLSAAMPAQDQGPPRPPWGLRVQDAIPISVPLEILSRVDLDLDTASIKGAKVDLDGDGVKDYMIQSAPSLCGQGGCEYIIVDGATGNVLGRLSGNRTLYVRREKAHGYPVIETYNHFNARSGTHTTYRFDGTAYVVASTRFVQGESFDRLWRALGRIQMWRPHP